MAKTYIRNSGKNNFLDNIILVSYLLLISDGWGGHQNHNYYAILWLHLLHHQFWHQFRPLLHERWKFQVIASQFPIISTFLIQIPPTEKPSSTCSAAIVRPDCGCTKTAPPKWQVTCVWPLCRNDQIQLIHFVYCVDFCV